MAGVVPGGSHVLILARPENPQRLLHLRILTLTPSAGAPFRCRVPQARVLGFGWGHSGQNRGARPRLAARVWETSPVLVGLCPGHMGVGVAEQGESRWGHAAVFAVVRLAERGGGPAGSSPGEGLEGTY